jgi:hypothetical protein
MGTEMIEWEIERAPLKSNGEYHLVQGGLFFLYSVLQYFVVRGIQARLRMQADETKSLRLRVKQLEKEVDECRA